MTCVVTNKSYIGKGNGKFRWRDHQRNALSGSQTHFCRAIRKYGAENFILSIEKEFENQHEAYAYEAMLIEQEDLIHRGYNEAPGMTIHVDHDQVNIARSETVKESWTPERRDEMSDRYKGSGNPFFGKSHDEATKKKISEASKKNVDAHKKISQMLKGRTMSKETRAKMSASSATRGKTYEEAYGKERAEELKEKLRNRPGMQGENHPGAKLTENDVRYIRAQIGGKQMDEMLAKEFNVSTRTIYKIRLGHAWKHVK